jgi:predicted acylesterase/phospholipase RssA
MTSAASPFASFGAGGRRMSKPGFARFISRGDSLGQLDDTAEAPPPIDEPSTGATDVDSASPSRTAATFTAAVATFIQTMRHRLYRGLIFCLVIYPLFVLRRLSSWYTQRQTDARQRQRCEAILWSTEEYPSWRAVAAVLDDFEGYREWRRAAVPANAAAAAAAGAAGAAAAAASALGTGAPANSAAASSSSSSAASAAASAKCAADRKDFDEERIREAADFVRRVTETRSELAIGTYLRTALSRNMYGIGSPALHRYYVGTKDAVDAYLSSVEAMIEQFVARDVAALDDDGFAGARFESDGSSDDNDDGNNNNNATAAAAAVARAGAARQRSSRSRSRSPPPGARFAAPVGSNTADDAAASSDSSAPDTVPSQRLAGPAPGVAAMASASSASRPGALDARAVRIAATLADVVSRQASAIVAELGAGNAAATAAAAVNVPTVAVAATGDDDDDDADANADAHESGDADVSSSAATSPDDEDEDNDDAAVTGAVMNVAGVGANVAPHHVDLLDWARNDRSHTETERRNRSRSLINAGAPERAVAAPTNTTTTTSATIAPGDAGPAANACSRVRFDAASAAAAEGIEDRVCAARPSGLSAADRNATFSRAPHHQLSAKDKFLLLKHAAQAFGRTALMLSGGASLGMYHAGVVRALWSAKLLPNIISGSSAGAIIAAIFCTRTDAEIDDILSAADASGLEQKVSLDAFDSYDEPMQSISTRVWRFLRTGAFMDVQILMDCMRRNCGDATFAEAYKRTGRILSIAVASVQREGGKNAKSMVLNYVTAPNVLIWTAVAASCAYPRLFTPVQLLQRHPTTRVVYPYLPGQVWSDGSITADLPAERLAELFNAEFFIVSQVNPHVAPFVRSSLSHLVHTEHKRATSFLSNLWYAATAELQYWILKLFRFGVISLEGENEILFLLMSQKYSGNVTIRPIRSFFSALPDYINLTTNPTKELLMYVTGTAQRRTWPHIAMLQSNMRVELALQKAMEDLRRVVRARQDHSSDEATVSASEDAPSRISDARPGHTGGNSSRANGAAAAASGSATDAARSAPRPSSSSWTTASSGHSAASPASSSFVNVSVASK